MHRPAQLKIGSPITADRRPPQGHRRSALCLRHAARRSGLCRAGDKRDRARPHHRHRRDRGAGGSGRARHPDLPQHRRRGQEDQAVQRRRLCRHDDHAARLRPGLARRPDRRGRARRDLRGGERRRAAGSSCAMRRRSPPPASTAPARRPSPPRTCRRPTRTRKSATRRPPSPPRRSRSTRGTRRRPSTTTRSSCSRQAAPGATAS